MSMLRTLATEKNVHIGLVIHPKKVEDDNNLSVGSIFGTAKVTQEADSVMILQKTTTPNLRFLQVKKNRFDGEVGEVGMLFNPDNKRYIEITPEEKLSMLLHNGAYDKIIKERIKKFGTIEPIHTLEAPALKTPKPDDYRHSSKMKKHAETDVLFFQKLRAHQHPESEPEENSMSAKTRNTYFTQTSSDSEASGTEGGVGGEVAADAELNDLLN